MGGWISKERDGVGMTSKEYEQVGPPGSINNWNNQKIVNSLA